MSRDHLTLLNHYNFSHKQLKNISNSQAKKLVSRMQKQVCQIIPRHRNSVHQVIIDTFKQQNANRYRKAKKDYDANKPEYARGRGNKYCETFRRDKITGEIERGAAVAKLP